MLSVTVEFLHGTCRADPDGLAHTGRMTRGEWPPSPLRILAALVAADGTGDRCRHTDGAELAYLEECAPPAIYANADAEVHHQPLLPRFVVNASDGPEHNTHQEYVARKGTEVRGGVRVSPRSPRAVYVWDVDAPGEVVDALRVRAARVGYLGCADSPVRVSVASTGPETTGDLAAYLPDPDGDVAIAAPAPGVLHAMDAHYQRWCEGGPSVSRSQSPGLRRLARYRGPGPPSPQVAVDDATVIWLVFDRAVPGRRVLAVSETLRATVLDRYQRVAGDPPPVLHGHGISGSGFDTARYLGLPDVGFRRSRGRLHGAAVWLPPGTDDGIIEGCRAALHGVDDLVGTGFAVGVTPWAGQHRPWAANPDRWITPASRWVSATPVVHERRTKTLTLAEIATWCSHAGLPDPVAFRSTRGPLVEGGVDLAPSEINRPGRPARPYSHVEVVFEEPVPGPVVIGAGRQFGLGLCAPHDPGVSPGG